MKKILEKIMAKLLIFDEKILNYTAQKFKELQLGWIQSDTQTTHHSNNAERKININSIKVGKTLIYKKNPIIITASFLSETVETIRQ